MTSVVASLAELDVDPYPVYRRLRADQPVCWLPDLKQWLVTRWADVATVLAEPDSFTTDIPGSGLIQLCAGVPLGAREGADHDEIREAVVHDYDPHRVNDFVDTIARPHAERLVAALLPFGHADLLGDYFEPAALLAHTALLGIDSDAARLRRWGMGMVSAGTNFHGDPDRAAEGRAAMADLDTVVDPLVGRLRAEPNESLISQLIHRAAGGQRGDTDVVPVVKQFVQGQLQGGWVGGWALALLLAHPEQLAQVRADRWLVGAAVYEALRWSSPVGVVTRRTTRPVVLSGQEIPADALLAVSVASANRDETVFAEPDMFDVHRTVRTHLGFGRGEHFCPAYAFVPAMARTALDVLLDRLPDIRPEPGWVPAPHGWKLRLPGPLNLTWTT
jgi:aromatic O-demethylase, cytochrome P450 subunit